jgi:hypothetical protein
MNMTPTGASLRGCIAGKFAQADGYICAWLKRTNTTKAFPTAAVEDAIASSSRLQRVMMLMSQSAPRQNNLRAANAEALRASVR